VTHEAQQRLVKLQREVALQRSQRARMEFYEGKQEQAQEVRRVMDELMGKEALRKLVKIHPLPDDEVGEWAADLTVALLKEYNLGGSQKSRAWIRLWRETDHRGTGRIGYSDFISMARRKLQLHPKSRKKREEVDQDLQQLWRALDKTADGAGDLKGFITLNEFMTFMKRSMESETHIEATAAQEARIGGWRQRYTLQRKAVAQAARDERLRRKEEDEMAGDLENWRKEMLQISPAKQHKIREASVGLNARLGSEEGWYSLYKKMDRSGDSKVSWVEFSTELRERLPSGDDVHLLRRVWRALDPGLTGFITLSDFGAWMRLGTQQSTLSASRQQLASQRARESAAREASEAEAEGKRAQKHLRMRMMEEADKLEAELRRMKEQEAAKRRGVTLPQIGGAQTERGRKYDYKKILYRDIENRDAYLGKAEAAEHRLRMQTYRSVSARVGRSI
jgi:Ca2+-binding EF-hand superfamily protein